MDSVTQVVLGSFVGYKICGKELGNKAFLFGAIVGTIPDLDVLVGSFYKNSLDKFLVHRGFSHSLLFAVLVSLGLAFVFQKYFKKNSITYFKGFLFLFLCLFTHALLDCCTTWGTQVFYPLPYRVAWSNVFVIDPIYTFPFILAFIFMVFKKGYSYTKKQNLVSKVLIATTLYLFAGFISQQLTLSYVKKELVDIEYDSINISPTICNIIKWKFFFKVGQKLYSGKASVFDIGGTKQLNYNFIGEDEVVFPKYLLEHPRGQEVIDILRGGYVLEKSAKGIFILDYRFYHFYDKAKKRDYSTFYYEVWKDGDVMLEFKSNRHRIKRQIF